MECKRLFPDTTARKISLFTGGRYIFFIAALILLLFVQSCGVNEPDIPPPDARFIMGCATIADSLVTFTNESRNAEKFHWDLGNGMASTEKEPSVRYPAAGAYTVTLAAENSKGVRDTMSRVVTIYPAIPGSAVLDIPFIAAGRSNWSWPAISEMILRYYGYNLDQCEILTHYYRTSCCTDSAGCGVVGSLQQIELDLERVALMHTEHQYSQLTLDQIRAEIAQNRPVVAGYEIPGFVHAMLIYGYDTSGNLLIHDPLTGPRIMPYTDALRYGSGSSFLDWTESTFCIRK